MMQHKIDIGIYRETQKKKKKKKHDYASNQQ